MQRRWYVVGGVGLVGIAVAASVGLYAYMATDNRDDSGHILTGIVTRKFTDCSGGEEMDSRGNISAIEEPISCDGGSTITIDYKETFVTTSGFVPQDMAFSTDVSSIRVGDKVTVRYAEDLDGQKSLNCVSCSVTKVK